MKDRAPMKGKELDPATPERNVLFFDELDLSRCVHLRARSSP